MLHGPQDKPQPTLDELHDAILTGEIGRASYLLKDESIINQIRAGERSSSQPTINQLLYAVVEDNIDEVNRLLQFDSIVKQITYDENTVFLAAAASGSIKVVERLLAFPEVKEQITAKKNHAFRYAANNGHVKVVEKLLEFKEVVELIIARDNIIYRRAKEDVIFWKGDDDEGSATYQKIVDLLLSIPAVLEYELSLTAKTDQVNFSDSPDKQYGPEDVFRPDSPRQIYYFYAVNLADGTEELIDGKEVRRRLEASEAQARALEIAKEEGDHDDLEGDKPSITPSKRFR